MYKTRFGSAPQIPLPDRANANRVRAILLPQDRPPRHRSTLLAVIGAPGGATRPPSFGSWRPFRGIALHLDHGSPFCPAPVPSVLTWYSLQLCGRPLPVGGDLRELCCGPISVCSKMLAGEPSECDLETLCVSSLVDSGAAASMF